MVQVHPKIKSFVIQKLEEDLSSKTILTDKTDLWVIDKDTKGWFIQTDSFGQLYYNKYYFKWASDIFSLSEHQLSVILREWFENNFELRVRNVARRPNNMEWAVEKVIKSKNSIIRLNERNGFTFGFVKKYLDIKKNNGKVLVEDYLTPVIA